MGTHQNSRELVRTTYSGGTAPLLISGGAGYLLLEEFAAKNVQVIAVSSINSAEDALNLGAAAFIQKPIEALALVSTVRDLLGSSALVGVKRKVRR